MKEKKNLRDFIFQSMLAAIYVCLTVIAKPISYGQIQIRISELLILLLLFSPKHLIGLTLGCFISNLFSPMMGLDLIFGTSATFIGGLLIIICGRKWWTLIFPVITNAFLVGMMLNLAFGDAFWLSVGYVALGEAIVMIIADILYFILRKNEMLVDALK